MTHSLSPDAQKARALRDALGRFATGVTVITITGPDAAGQVGPMGFTANSFSALSLAPPLVLWAVAKASRRAAAFAAAPHFAVHVLAKAQGDLSARFAGGGAGFAGLPALRNPEGVPLLQGCLARFDCAHHACHDGGDHLIIVGQVLRFEQDSGAPLIFNQGVYGSFTPHG
ncbi:flavin reductase family protein [Rhodobacter ferrooxidans]|uniref:Flavin reductase domain protein FMN-binding n=1 Tax=Rhodobacter ferrooxidans TaxID=371731 RepID=C8S0C2_9RHOB|nr:flavin reductase family protein [Rhodobacter sp. SW2]EEW25456.1 flavin reductase domain protein FMN-binding [Rhodobacter sp. SW2]